MRKQVAARDAVPARLTYGELPAAERPDYLRACRALTDAVYEGLDLEREIVAAHRQLASGRGKRRNPGALDWRA